MGGDETGYGHQNVALGAFEDGFEVLGLGALPAVARGKDGTGEFRRVDTAVGDPLAYGGADDDPTEPIPSMSSLNFWAVLAMPNATVLPLKSPLWRMAVCMLAPS